MEFSDSIRDKAALSLPQLGSNIMCVIKCDERPLGKCDSISKL